MTKLVVIDAPYFYACITLTNGIVTEAAPIIRWMKGMSRHQVWRVIQARGWQVPAVYELQTP